MKVRIWGARGSIPVSGKEYLKYGGDTTCVEIRTNNDEIIIVDAGSGIRQLGNTLLAEQRNKFNLNPATQKTRPPASGAARPRNPAAVSQVTNPPATPPPPKKTP